MTASSSPAALRPRRGRLLDGDRASGAARRAAAASGARRPAACGGSIRSVMRSGVTSATRQPQRLPLACTSSGTWALEQLAGDHEHGRPCSAARRDARHECRALAQRDVRQLRAQQQRLDDGDIVDRAGPSLKDDDGGR